MLRALIAFAGFDRPKPVPLPRRRRTPAPTNVSAMSDKVSGLSDRPTVDGLYLTPHGVVARAPTAKQPRTTAEAVVTMSKLYGGSGTYRSWFGRPDAFLDARCRIVLGDELHSYCRALFLVGSKTPTTVRHSEADDAYDHLYRVNLETDAASDIDTWERAMDAHAALSKTHRRAGLPLPDALTIPEAVLIAIAQRQAERAERLGRSTAGGRSGKGGPAQPKREGTLAELKAGDNDGESASLKGGGKKRKKDDEKDGGGFTPPTPAGPRR